MYTCRKIILDSQKLKHLTVVSVDKDVSQWRFSHSAAESIHSTLLMFCHSLVNFKIHLINH